MRSSSLFSVASVALLVACGGNVVDVDGGAAAGGSSAAGAGKGGASAGGAPSVLPGGSGPSAGGNNTKPPPFGGSPGFGGSTLAGGATMASCTVASDCPSEQPGSCSQLCPDSGPQCGVGTCNQGTCGLVFPPCAVDTECNLSGVPDCGVCPGNNSEVCIGGQCVAKAGSKCDQGPCAGVGDCVPCDPCPDGDCAGGSAFVCQSGVCLPTAEAKCGVVPPMCNSDVQCAIGGACELCPDGMHTVCPSATCDLTTGSCVDTTPSCPAECLSPSDCPPQSCQLCDDGSKSCPQVDCEKGVCVVLGPACQNACAHAACGTPCKSIQSPTGIGTCDGAGDCVPDDGGPMGCAGNPCDFTMCPASCSVCSDGSEICSAGVCDPKTGTCDVPPTPACPTNGCTGLKCGDSCSLCPPGETCGPDAGFCDITGVCEAKPSKCTF